MRASTSFSEEKAGRRQSKKTFIIWALGFGLCNAPGPDSRKFLRRGRPAAFFKKRLL
jgi:hypothetical protein